jgi:hypothetical protein
MAEKLYKQKCSKEDILAVENYMRQNGASLCVEIWQDDNDDGDVYEIQANGLVQAIAITDKYYDSINARKKVAELILREKNGEYTCIYHTEKNRSGITYEVLNYAKGIN